MAFKTDNGGLALHSGIDMKLSTSYAASSWNTRLSQIGRTDDRVVICTYSLPRIDYARRILDKRSEGVTIIANSRFARQAEVLNELYPALQVHLLDDVHAKMVLVGSGTTWLSSANFGSSRWFEHTVGIHNKQVNEFYLDQLCAYTGLSLA